jgi:hypothetical protein
MPTFDYRCPGCGHTREVWVAPVRDTDAAIMDLPCVRPDAPEGVMCDHDKVPSAPAVIIPAKHRAA